MIGRDGHTSGEDTVPATRIIAIVLVATAALFFTLVGADAAGLVDAPRGVPALAELARREPRDRSPASIQLTPSPLTIDCDGVQSSLLTVRLTDARGKAVEDGTEVHFVSYDAGVEIVRGETRRGEASARIIPNQAGGWVQVTVGAGELEASIVIRCRPVPSCQPMSPPQHPMSPPCEPQPGCNIPFSPPQHPMSPPCEEPPGCTNAFSPPQPFSPPCSTPEPPCEFSPPQHPMSPPCPLPTPEPCPAGVPGCALTLALDCNPDTVTVEPICQRPRVPGERMSVGIVLANNGAEFAPVSGFALEVVNDHRALLTPVEIGGLDPLNSNPDFGDLPGNWRCDPPVPVADTGDGGPTRSVSFLSCFMTNPGDDLSLAPGESVVLGTVLYETASDPVAANNQAGFSFSDAVIGGPSGEVLGSCNPVIEVEMVCLPAEIRFSPPPPLYYGLDCDTATPGVQDDCTLAPGATSIDVAVVAIRDETTGPYSCDGVPDCTIPVSAFQFDVRNPDSAFLFPPPGGSDNYNSNPDFNEAVFEGDWNCTILPPDNDTGAGGPGRTVSFLGCFTNQGGTPGPIPPDSQVVLGVVRYEVAGVGSPTLTLDNVVAGDGLGVEVGGCGSNGFSVPTRCNPASISSGSSEEIASCMDFTGQCETAIAAAVTATPTPTPAVQARSLTATCPDIDGDGAITEADLALVQSQLSTRGADAAPYDVNSDGRVSRVDALIVASRIGRPCA